MAKNLQIENLTSQELYEGIQKTVKKAVDESIKNLKTEDELLTRSDTSKVLKVTLPTLHKWTKEGRIRAYRIGNRIRYKRSEIDNALRSIPGKHERNYTYNQNHSNNKNLLR